MFGIILTFTDVLNIIYAINFAGTFVASMVYDKQTPKAAHAYLDHL